MTLTLTLRTEPPARVLAAPLIPERLRALNASAVAGLTLRCGGERVAVGDLFEVSGAGAEESELVLDGDLRRFDWVGAGMTGGEIVVRGEVGAGREPRCQAACCGSTETPARGSGLPIPAPGSG